jgi:peptidoglycan/LPS O-acetylase OafA/YrhL
VVAAHSKLIPRGFSGVGGEAAVEAFFIISGVYIGLVLENRYSKRTKAFFLNRALRIFPEFWIVGLFTLISYTFLNGPQIVREITELPQGLSALLTLANSSIFGSDFVMFLQLKDGQLSLGPFWESDPPLFSLLLIPQAWTLSLELCFYVLSPIIIRIKSSWLVAYVFFVFASKYLLCGFILELEDPWTYRFFPFELGFFLIGILISRRISKRPLNFQPAFPSFVYWSFLICLFILAPKLLEQNLTYSFWISKYVIQFVLVISIALLIEPLYWRTKQSIIDEKIGFYSYPLYLVHILTIFWFTNILTNVEMSNSKIVNYLVSVFFILFLFATTWPLVQVGKHLEKIRDKVRG